MNANTKKCPMCAEEIQAEARICHYCGARFEVAVKGYCTHCHILVDADENGKCRQCGSDIVDRRVESTLLAESPAPPAPSPSAPLVQARELDVFERKGEGVANRWGAFILDIILLGILYTVISVIYIVATVGASGLAGVRSQEDLQNLLATTVALLPIIWFGYFVLLEGTFGVTFGKACAGLKVIRKDASRSGYGRAAVRALFNLFESNLLGAIVIWLTPAKQRLGDLVAGTLVVNRQRLLKVAFYPDCAVFEFHDGRQAEIAHLSHDVITKFGRVRTIRLEGTARNGQRTRLALTRYSFPNRYKMDQIQDELESFFGVRFAERVEWWRLLAVLIVLALLGALAIGVMLRVSSIGNPPGLTPQFPTSSGMAVPTKAALPPTPMPTPTSRRAEVPAPTPKPTPTPTPIATSTRLPSTADCAPNAAFVQDVSVPDGTQFKPGESYSKTWRMRSSGCAPWEPGTRWVFVSGDQLGAPEAVDVPDTRLKGTADISVPMRAPDDPGTYKSIWQMQGPDGRRFGDTAFVMIVVPGEVVTPTPATCPPNPALVSVINELNASLTLVLEGPQNCRLRIPAGETQNICVEPGTYSYTASVSGYASQTGDKALEPGDPQCWWWYAGFQVHPLCRAPTDPGVYSPPR